MVIYSLRVRDGLISFKERGVASLFGKLYDRLEKCQRVLQHPCLNNKHTSSGTVWSGWHEPYGMRVVEWYEVTSVSVN